MIVMIKESFVMIRPSLSRASRSSWLLGLVLGILAVAPAMAEEPEPLIFGTLPITQPSKLLAKYGPLVEYYEQVLGQPVKLEIGRNYRDTIAKFQSGHYDFGFLGPAPYVVATQTSPEGKKNFRLVATLETAGKPYYHAIVIAALGNNDINALSDLAGKRFAFGSRLSTLSCYLPADMLIQSGVMESLAGFEFIGKHDAVANAVHLGRFDAGGVKEEIGQDFADKVKVVARSEPVWDFLILAHKDMDDALFERIKAATLELRDEAILASIKNGATGFVATEDSNYDNLRGIMERVDSHLGQPEL